MLYMLILLRNSTIGLTSTYILYIQYINISFIIHYIIYRYYSVKPDSLLDIIFLEKVQFILKYFIKIFY